MWGVEVEEFFTSREGIYELDVQGGFVGAAPQGSGWGHVNIDSATSWYTLQTVSGLPEAGPVPTAVPRHGGEPIMYTTGRGRKCWTVLAYRKQEIKASYPLSDVELSLE